MARCSTQVSLGKYGKEWDGRETLQIAGKTPFEAASAVVEDYGLPCSPIEFISEISPLFSDQWCNIKALPGANRLIKHLKSNGVPMVLASNSPRESIDAKISFHDGWKDSFSVIIGGDEVRTAKPSPDIFFEAARRLCMEPSSCLVIEDSLGGGNFACRSLVYWRSCHQGFWSWVESTRYSYRTIQISFQSIPQEFILVGLDYQQEEPWLLHEFSEDFYGEELRLVIVGYIRPEENFPSLESLIAKIHEDRRVAERALDLPMYSSHKNDAYLRSS
ncbi:hypothetical protein KIW84_072838 [Lathyrus oleraceus]|uniref:riboflavin kinase n=1 Tax=Pisum sativum TaxID=3888 RepID=A0A9D4VM21_PEA|nr:hypothetical protein KIW84_072838 [Pisum sativum]